MNKSLGKLMANDLMYKEHIIKDQNIVSESLIHIAIKNDALKVFNIIKNKIATSSISYESCKMGSITLCLKTKVKYNIYNKSIFFYELNLLLQPQDLQILQINDIRYTDISWGREYEDQDPIPVVCCSSCLCACIPLIFYWIPMYIYRITKKYNNYEIDIIINIRS